MDQLWARNMPLRIQIFEYLRETIFVRALGYLEPAPLKKMIKWFVLPTDTPDHN